MKIYTSYFGALTKLPKDFVPIAICGGMTFPWPGLRYTKLAPRKSFFFEWQKTHDNAYYIKHFNDEVLSKLTQDQVRKELAELAGGNDKTVVLLCYETPEKFCHRHLVAEWLGDVEEYDAVRMSKAALLDTLVKENNELNARAMQELANGSDDFTLAYGHWKISCSETPFKEGD